MIDIDWTDHAACKEKDPDGTIFHPPEDTLRTRRRNLYDAARVICEGCIVKDACLDDAMRTEFAATRYGMRGGLSPDERRDLGRGIEPGTRRRKLAS